MVKPLRVSKEDKDTYIITLYDDTKKKYNSSELKSQLSHDLTSKELSQVMSVSPHQEATINMTKEAPKKVMISDYLTKYYGVPDKYSRKFITSSDDKILTVVTPDGIYSKKFNSRDDCKEELKQLYNLDDAEFLKSLDGFHRSSSSIKNESLETDAEKLTKELVKNKVIDNDEKKAYLDGILSSNYDYYPKPLLVKELKRDDVFTFVDYSNGEDSTTLLKVIDIYPSSIDGKTSKFFYDMAVVSYPHYDYKLFHQIIQCY